MSVKNRIKQYPACEAIDLTEDEKNAGIYHGAGVAIAKFLAGELVGIYYLAHHTVWDEDKNKMANDALEAARGWLTAATAAAGEADEFWLVECSCYQLCEPRRITLTDAGALARMARMIGDELAAT